MIQYASEKNWTKPPSLTQSCTIHKFKHSLKNRGLQMLCKNCKICKILNLIKISKPNIDEKIKFVWPEGILKISQDQLIEYNCLFDEKHY